MNIDPFSDICTQNNNFCLKEKKLQELDKIY